MTDFQKTPPDIAAPRVPSRERLAGKRQGNVFAVVVSLVFVGFILGRLSAGV